MSQQQSSVSADQYERSGEIFEEWRTKNQIAHKKLDDKTVLAYFSHLKTAGKKDGSGGLHAGAAEPLLR